MLARWHEPFSASGGDPGITAFQFQPCDGFEGITVFELHLRLHRLLG